MPVLTLGRTGLWLFDFQPSDACRLATSCRLHVTRVIHETNGALNLPSLPVGQHLDSHMGLGIGSLLEVSLHNK